MRRTRLRSVAGVAEYEAEGQQLSAVKRGAFIPESGRRGDHIPQLYERSHRGWRGWE